MVMMADAVILACLQISKGAVPSSEPERNMMAWRLCQLVTLYLISDHRDTVRAFNPADLKDGSFVNGGRTMVFPDGRPPIEGLGMTRTALEAAIETLKQSV